MQLLAAQLEFELASGRGLNPYEAMTLGEAMEKYIELKSAILSPSTLRGYDSIRRNRVPGLLSMRLRDITQESVQYAVNEDALTHSPKSVRNLYGFLSVVLNVYKHELKLNITLPQRVKAKISIPTQEEVDKLFAHFSGTEMEIPFALAACCGLRVSEICALRWENVDLPNGRIEIRVALVKNTLGEYVEKGTKSESGQRTIRIYPYVQDALERAERRGEYLTALSAHTIYNRFKRALVQLDLPDYRFHDLRHYLVSVMLSLNIPKSYIADYVGHANESMVERVYGHIMASKKTSVEDTMDAYFRHSATKSVTNL